MITKNDIPSWVGNFDLDSLNVIKESVLELSKREFVPIVITMSDKKEYNIKLCSMSEACMVDSSNKPIIDFYYFEEMKKVRKFILKDKKKTSDN